MTQWRQSKQSLALVMGQNPIHGDAGAIANQKTTIIAQVKRNA
jgi:hypothetical protein